MNKVDRDNNFAILHIAAAIMVMCGHEFLLLGVDQKFILGIEYHTLGVYILFFISGYLSSGSYLRNEGKIRFIAKRLIRMYPSLMVCLFITTIIMSVVTVDKDGYLHSAFEYIVANGLMRTEYHLSGVFLSNPYPEIVNGSFWTLPIELFCYVLLIPVIDFMLFIKSKLRDWYLLVAMILFMCFYILEFFYMANYPESKLVIWGSDMLIGEKHIMIFLLGAILKTIELDKKIYNLQFACILILFYTYLNESVQAFVRPFVVGYAVLSFALAKAPLFSKVIKRDVCYGLYLWAFPIQQLVILCFISANVRPSLHTCLTISIIITWLCAELQYRFIEGNVFLQKKLSLLIDKEYCLWRKN